MLTLKLDSYEKTNRHYPIDNIRGRIFLITPVTAQQLTIRAEQLSLASSTQSSCAQLGIFMSSSNAVDIQWNSLLLDFSITGDLAILASKPLMQGSNFDLHR